MATNHGLTIFNSSEVGINKIQPPVYFTNLRIMNRDTTILKNYRLPYDKNFIEISFVGLSYRNAGAITYKYKMSGINNQWVYSKSNLVAYPFLPDGSYTFEVYSLNEDGIESIKPATFTFVIQPPFWKRWWFLFGCVIIIIGLIRIVFYFRVKALKRRNMLRLKLNKYMQQALSKQMNPHFIFNSLNSIQYYLLQNDRISSNKYLSKFARLMRIILENSQHQVIPIKDELSALTLYIELESMRFKDKFEYTIEVDQDLDTGLFKIPPLLIQPYVENAIWHGLMHKEGKGILSVTLCLRNNLIICLIKDNGVGREKASEINDKKMRDYKSLGTKITGGRLKLINTLNNMQMNINYIDEKDEAGNAAGTCVEISIPLIK